MENYWEIENASILIANWSIGCELQLWLADKSTTKLWAFLFDIPWVKEQIKIISLKIKVL